MKSILYFYNRYKFIQFFYNVLKFLIIYPIILLQIINIIFKLKHKNKIIIYHYGWGTGHSLHDTEYFRKVYKPNDIALIFFNEGKHNVLLSKVFEDINLIFVKCFIKIPKYSSKIKLNKKYNMYFSFLTERLLKNIYPRKEIDTIESIRSKICEEKNVSSNNLHFLFEPDYQNPNRKPIILPLKYVNRIEAKLAKFFSDDFNTKKKNIITFYLRYKGNDPNEKSETYRSSSTFSSYLKIFLYLINKGYHIFIYGDYKLDDLKQNGLYNKIASYEALNLNRDEFCIYSALNCEYFISSTGGGTYFPFSSSKYPKTLILNAYPFSFDIPFATIVYKNIINDKGQFLNVNDLMSFKENHDLNSKFKVIDNNEALIYESVIEFINFHSKNINIKDSYIKKNSSSKNKIRLSPVWIRYTESSL